MLGRYKIHRGARPADDPLPSGIRQDTRKHTSHCLRPTNEMVAKYLDDLSEQGWRRFRDDYLAMLDERFRHDRESFDQLRQQAKHQDVLLGCNCPTKKNPDVHRCHTVLALRFMKRKYPSLKVVIP